MLAALLSLRASVTQSQSVLALVSLGASGSNTPGVHLPDPLQYFIRKVGLKRRVVLVRSASGRSGGKTLTSTCWTEL